MLSIVRAHYLCGLLFIMLIVSGCSIEIDQTTGNKTPPPTESNLATSATALFPSTHLPVTWTHLNLTGKLIYLSSTTENDTVTSTIQMLDLVTGDIGVIFSVPRSWVYYVTVSPDATNMVISYVPPATSNVLPNRILYIMPLDTAIPPQPLFTPPTPDDRYIQAEWSPDGEYIYYVQYDPKIRPPGQLDPVYNIFRMKYPDGQPEKIADHSFWPRISPDSSKIVYITINPDSGLNELFIANADGSSPQKIDLAPEIIDAPIFSPDGRSILLSVPSPVRSYQPNWFEKLVGIQIAKAHNVPSDWWSIPVMGGVPIQLTNIQTINLFASVSPDGKYVVSVSGDGIFLMDLDGSGLTQIINDLGVHGTVNWIP